MSAQQGRFVWYDLMMNDAASAVDFYTGVFGWTAAPAAVPNEAYTILSAGETMVGGIMALPPGAQANGARPCWQGYVGVADLDAMLPRVTAAGGAVLHGPIDIVGVGRFVVVADPQGAVFELFQPGTARPGPAAMANGHVAWNELHAADAPGVFGFYGDLFGWEKASAVDMGPMGVYQIFGKSGVDMGGMMTRMNPAIPPHWLFYVGVPEVGAAMARVRAGGGQVLNGPQEVPGGAFVAQCMDPQGAAFGMVGMKV